MRTSVVVAAIAATFFVTAAEAVPLPRPRPTVVTPEYCLAHVIYQEARGEADEGQLLVGFVTRMRALHARADWGGPTICGVAGHSVVVNGVRRAQYDGVKDLSTWVPRDKAAWERAKHFAGVVLRGEFVPQGELRYATYYLSRETSSLTGRCWFDRDLIPIARKGAHFFYREPLPREAADLKASAMPDDCPAPAKKNVIARR